ncbi:MAG: sugar transferase [Candidatus Binatia bacterium]
MRRSRKSRPRAAEVSTPGARGHQRSSRVTRPGGAAGAEPRTVRGPSTPAEASARSPIPIIDPVDTRRHEQLYTALHAAASLVALLALSPLMLAIAVAIKLTSKGSVLYRGQRVGRGERIFTIFKFRTLVEGAEQTIGARLLTAADRESLATPIGRLLKKSKLDELPQLLNVLKGDMRLVGPRPVRPVFLPQFKREIPGYVARLLVPPGITGIAQLRGGYYTRPRNKLRYDLSYVRNRSLLLDLKIVLLTIVKVLDRWIPAGVIVLFLFLFVSFVPEGLRGSLRVPVFGTELSLVYVLILLAISLAAAHAIVNKDRGHFSLYRSPVNRATLVFLLLGFAAAPFSPEPYRYLQGVGYYAVTGFLVAFLIVNTLVSEGLTALVVRGIALTSVVMSLLGLGQLLLVNGGVALASPHPEELFEGYVRIASVLGSPMLLAVYLVLGIPLLFCEVSRARTQQERDFWLVCSTISVIGIVFTQTRVGLLALLVTGTFFLSRRLGQAFSFVAAFALCFVLFAAAGVSRFSPVRIGEEVGAWIDRQAPILEAVPARQWLTGAGPGHPFWRERPAAERADVERRYREVPNMHLTLAREHGVGGWLVTVWLILSALWTMKKAHDEVADERLKLQLWAIMSCIVGFLVSMNGMNTFHNLPIQIFFWSLVGIGLQTVNHARRRRRLNLIWRFGDAGD